MEIKITDKIDDQHLSHYWYGGQCATIKHRGYTFSIEAIGDVYFEYKGGSMFKDKNNAGKLYSELCSYIKDDNALYKAIENNELVFDANNWWECFVYDPEGGFHDIMWCLDASSLTDAIEEVKESIDDIIEQIKEDL